MAAMKSILGLLALLVVLAWSEVKVVKKTSDASQWEREITLTILKHLDRKMTVAERLEKVNIHLKPNQDGVEVRDDIVVSSQKNADPCVLKGCKWPKASDGKVYVPYIIAKSYTTQQVGIITSALNSFSSSTCVRFIPRTNQAAYVNIQSLNGCYSAVGRQGNAQTLSLNSAGCVYFGIVQHELIHALGFHHEQCRSDRDQYIKVLLQNVISGMEFNFDKINTLNQGTPYDYNSVMHYGRLAFSKDNISPTMVAVPNSKTVFGMATQMSQNDINRINLLYCS